MHEVPNQPVVVEKDAPDVEQQHIGIRLGLLVLAGMVMHCSGAAGAAVTLALRMTRRTRSRGRHGQVVSVVARAHGAVAREDEDADLGAAPPYVCQITVERNVGGGGWCLTLLLLLGGLAVDGGDP